MKPVLELKKTEKKDYAFDEAIKTLRTNIQFSANRKKVILITSAKANEGKSSISYELSVSMTQIGKKVLLVDADIWRSVFITRYQIEQEIFGLSQYLSGQKELDEVVYDTNIERFHLLPAGPFAPNPTNLFEDPLFTQMLDKAREEYDYIIVDTPPLNSVIDAAVIAKYCDGAVLVLQAGGVSYKVAQKVKGQLVKSGCPILGVVLNKVNTTSKGYYYGSYYGTSGGYYPK